MGGGGGGGAWRVGGCRRSKCGRLRLLLVSVEHLAPQIWGKVLCVADIVHLHVPLLLHSPILEPHLDGAFRQAQLGGQLAPPWPRYVGFNGEFLLQLGQLFPRESSPISSNILLMTLALIVLIIVLLAIVVALMVVMMMLLVELMVMMVLLLLLLMLLLSLEKLVRPHHETLLVIVMVVCGLFPFDSLELLEVLHFRRVGAQVVHVDLEGCFNRRMLAAQFEFK